MAACLCLQWDASPLGVERIIVSASSWIASISLIAFDSYLFFTIATAIIGWAAMRGDGVGKVINSTDVKDAFLSGISWSRRTPLATRFAKCCMPAALKCNVDPNTVFRRPWDQFIMSLREHDLISNEEQCRLMYGDAVLGISNSRPLFLYAGKLKRVLQRANKIAKVAFACDTDDQLTDAAFEDEPTAEAFGEVMKALPPILAMICQSHASIGWQDAFVGDTLRALFSVPAGVAVHEHVAALLSSIPKPKDTLRTLAGVAAQIMIEFEKTGASTRLRGSPLLSLTVDFLKRVYKIFNPSATEADMSAAGLTQTGDDKGKGHFRLRIASGMRAGMGHHSGGDPSFAGPTMERLAYAAMHASTMSMPAGGAMFDLGGYASQAHTLEGLDGAAGGLGGGMPGQEQDTGAGVGLGIWQTGGGAAGAASGDGDGGDAGDACAAIPLPQRRPAHARYGSVVADGPLMGTLAAPAGMSDPRASQAASLLGLPTPAQPADGRPTAGDAASAPLRMSALLDTRSLLGIIRLLQTPNDSTGFLDGDGDPSIRERYEILRESARRVFYLLTMSYADGGLVVPEAERRLAFFVNSLYMKQVSGLQVEVCWAWLLRWAPLCGWPS